MSIINQVAYEYKELNIKNWKSQMLTHQRLRNQIKKRGGNRWIDGQLDYQLYEIELLKCIRTYSLEKYPNY